MFQPDETGMTDEQKALNALEYEIGKHDLEFVDNVRVCREGDPEAFEAYLEAQASGCCGFFDTTVVIDGVKWYIGCNHGH